MAPSGSFEGSTRLIGDRGMGFRSEARTRKIQKAAEQRIAQRSPPAAAPAAASVPAAAAAAAKKKPPTGKKVPAARAKQGAKRRAGGRAAEPPGRRASDSFSDEHAWAAVAELEEALSVKPIGRRGSDPGPPELPESKPPRRSRPPAPSKAGAAKKAAAKPSACVDAVKELEAKRAARRAAAEASKLAAAEELAAVGGDKENLVFHRCLAAFETKLAAGKVRAPAWSERRGSRITVCIRKRPLLPRELAKGAFDIVRCVGEHGLVCHEPRSAAAAAPAQSTALPTTHLPQRNSAPIPVRSEPTQQMCVMRRPEAPVDSVRRRTNFDMHRTLDSHPFGFDRVFDEHSTTDQIYSDAVEPELTRLFAAVRQQQAGGGGRQRRGGPPNLTMFAYGQTGSGKTHTMVRQWALHSSLAPAALSDIAASLCRAIGAA